MFEDNVSDPEIVHRDTEWAISYQHISYSGV